MPEWHPDLRPDPVGLGAVGALFAGLGLIGLLFPTHDDGRGIQSPYHVGDISPVVFGVMLLLGVSSIGVAIHMWTHELKQPLIPNSSEHTLVTRRPKKNRRKRRMAQK